MCPDSVSRQVAQKPLPEVLLFPVPVAPFVVPMSLAPEAPFVAPVFPVPVVPSVEPMFPVPVAPSEAPLFPAAGPLFPVPVAPSVALTFPVLKSLADWFLVPVSVATPFLESESQAQVFLWSGSLSSLSPVQQD